MTDFTKARLLKTGEVITPKGRMVYPALFKPSAPKGESEDKAKYQVTLLLPKEADLALLAEVVQQTIVDKWGADATKKYKIRKPFLKVDEQPKLADHADKFPVMIRANSKDRPSVVYANLQQCNDEADVYGGRWACVLLKPYAYDHQTGGKGVSFGLQHVQLLDNDEPLGGGKIRPEDAFEAAEASDAPKASAESLFE